MANQTELRARLAEAEAAVHEVTLGLRVLTVAYEGKSLTYSRTNAAALHAYIADLKGQLGMGGRRPMGVQF